MGVKSSPNEKFHYGEDWRNLGNSYIFSVWVWYFTFLISRVLINPWVLLNAKNSRGGRSGENARAVIVD